MKRLFGLVCLALLLVAPGFAHSQNLEPAKTVAETLHGAMLETMKAAQAGKGFQARFELLAPSLDKTYAYAEMARVASGRFWQNFSDDEKAKVAKAYGRMSASTYAARLSGFSGERFETLGAEAVPAPGKGVMVNCRIVRSTGNPVPISYLVQQMPEGWRIVDVYYNGSISELATQRSQYLAVLRDKGSTGLLARLDELSNDLASGKSAGK
ncbi:MAG: ABC transporter substrate-binding protein [Alphaproteobacteria bacterium]|nr:ABC transporter substrate-binding protein [Alphaproteobacteria bacterium]